MVFLVRTTTDRPKLSSDLPPPPPTRYFWGKAKELLKGGIDAISHRHDAMAVFDLIKEATEKGR